MISFKKKVLPKLELGTESWRCHPCLNILSNNNQYQRLTICKLRRRTFRDSVINAPAASIDRSNTRQIHFTLSQTRQDLVNCKSGMSLLLMDRSSRSRWSVFKTEIGLNKTPSKSLSI